MTLLHSSRFKRLALLASAALLLTAATLQARLQSSEPAPAKVGQQAKTAWLASALSGGSRAILEDLATPTNLRAVDVGDGLSVAISWTASASDVVENVIERQRSVSGTWVSHGRLRLWGTQTAFRDTPGLGTFRYRVAAVEPRGRSEYSDWKAVTVLNLPPGISLAAFQRNPDRPIGMNLDAYTYYTKDWVFVDAFKASGGWSPRRASRIWETPDVNGASLALDAQGNPTHIPQMVNGESVVVVTSLLIAAWPYPVGNWTLLYDGVGDFTIDFDARIVTQSRGRIVVEVGRTTSHDGVRIYLTRSLLSDPVRNIRLIAPGFEQTYAQHPFYTPYLERLAPFQIIRFLNWGKANNSPESLWSNRTRPDEDQGGDKGVAYENMIDLTNRLGADPWITVPHLANDDYMRQLARLIRDQMAPDRKVYVEFSNEVWNWGFTQRAWSAAQPGGYPLSYINRSLDLFRIFEEEFGGADRLVRVIAGQAVNSSLTQWAIRPAMVSAGAIGKFDAFAIAPYFGHSLPAVTNASTPEEILAMLEPMVDSAITDMVNQRVQTDLMQARLICYEGGQHLTAGNDDTRIAQFAAVNRHPLFYNLLLRYHSAWFQQTSEPFVAYKFSSPFDRYGYWGYFENMLQQRADAPKMRAILDASRGTP